MWVSLEGLKVGEKEIINAEQDGENVDDLERKSLNNFLTVKKFVDYHNGSRRWSLESWLWS